MPEVSTSALNSSFLEEGESLHEVPVTPVKAKGGLTSPTDSIYVCQPCSEQQSSNDESRSDENAPVSSSHHPALEFIEQEEEPTELTIGDHVYQWRKWAGIPAVFQHHGIVMDVIKDDQDEVVKLAIADFSNVEPDDKKQKDSKTNKNSKRRSGLFQEGILRTYTDTDKWHKVQYESNWWKRQVFRSGTCTSAKSDAVGLVLARVNFIIQFPELLPDYHVVYSNCECVAFWCKTGNWCTLQASSFLELTAAGQVKSAATLTATAATTQVTVPAAGVWGWLGFTSNVSYLSLHPMVLPALVGYAAVAVGTPTMIYMRARDQWKNTTNRLCEAFWESAMEQPECFAECITHWADKN